MADNTKIEWADATWNPVRALHPIGPNGADGTKLGWHCEHVSEGCRNCYAETFNQRRLGTGLPYKPGHRADVTHFLDQKMLLAPLRRRKPTRYFLSSMTDIFGAWVPDEHLDRIFAVMALAPQHTFMVLTKRSERMRAYLAGHAGHIGTAIETLRRWLFSYQPGLCLDRGLQPNGPYPLPWVAPGTSWFPLPNVWLGTSVEDQRAADERIPHLLATPAAVRFLSCEPLLGPVDLTRIKRINGDEVQTWNALTGGWQVIDGDHFRTGLTAKIDLVIAGGESGKNARAPHPDWFRVMRDQCATAGTAFNFKQWGEWGRVADQRPAVDHLPQDADTLTRCGRSRAGRLLDGRTHDEFPARP